MDKSETTPSTSPVNDQTTAHPVNQDHLVSPIEVGSQPMANENPVIVKKEPNLGEFKQDSPNTVANLQATETSDNQKPTEGATNSNSNNHTSDFNKSDGNHNQPHYDNFETDQKSSRTGTIITVILVIIIMVGIWQTNKDNSGQTGDSNSDNVNIVVDPNQETGTVTIVDGDQANNTDSEAMGDTVKIVAYYNKNGASECENVVSLERTVAKKYDSDVVNTVRGLLTPLSSDEVSQGWLSSIPVNTYLKNVIIKDGVAEVTFSSALNNVAGSCRVLAIRSQIEKTLLQFSYVQSVNICIDNNCNQAEILQP